MRSTTELLIALAAASVLAWHGYQLAVNTFIAKATAEQRVAQLEQALQGCIARESK